MIFKFSLCLLVISYFSALSKHTTAKVPFFFLSFSFFFHLNPSPELAQDSDFNKNSAVKDDVLSGDFFLKILKTFIHFFFLFLYALIQSFC